MARVIRVEIDRPPLAEVDVDSLGPEERHEWIQHHLGLAETAAENGDIAGFFDMFKKAANTVVNKGKDVIDKSKKKATEVYNIVQTVKPKYQVELPDRFYGEMEMLIEIMAKFLKIMDPADTIAPSVLPQPTPSAPSLPAEDDGVPSAPPMPGGYSEMSNTGANPALKSAHTHAGHPMYYLVLDTR